MKKYLCIFISVCLIILIFSSCQKPSKNDDADNAIEYEEQDTLISKTEETPSITDINEDNEKNSGSNANTELLPLPQKTVEFSFLSGAGGWRTYIILNVDGTFKGQYHDSEMGSMGEDYPNGSVYISDFSGKFEYVEKINDYSYKMRLANISLEKDVGEEWIEDGIKYIASEPYGLEKGEDFVLYLPDVPISTVSAEFLTWWPYRYGQNENPRETLGCYGILNVTMEYGFFNAL